MKLVKFNRFPTLFNDLHEIFYNDFVWNEKLVPLTNIKENDGAYLLEISAPGMKKEQFKINVEDKQLIVSTENAEKKECKQEKYMMVEFSASSFYRSFTLPDNVKADEIKAKYEDGILYVDLPKTDVNKVSKAIEVK